MSDRVRFGEFELDLQSGELCSAGAIGDQPKSRIVLPQQPFRLLVMLTERDGAMVTRDEIQNKFWPNDTIVEFDHSINVAIGKLRKALGDSAEKPQYIATLARRGYRLMVPVTRIVAAEDSRPDAPAPALAEGADPQFQAAAVLTGQIVSHYRVLDIIGGGGMGLVYRAEDLKLGRRVAIKFLPDETATDAVTLQRFEREAQTASSLNHPNICTIYEFGEHRGQPFLVMELLQGETLRDRLAAAAEGTGLPLEEVLEIALQVSRGLQAAHDRGIIHRDIKPANIFLADHSMCKILDFGLAKMLERPEPETATYSVPGSPQFNSPVEGTLSRVGLVMGTAGYMSPEQALAKPVDSRTDLFSFGAVLYEMGTGHLAFRGDSAAAMFDAILNRTPVSPVRLNPDLPPALERIINRALEKDPELRYQSAAEMRSELQRLKRDTESGKAAAVGFDLAAGAPDNRSHAASIPSRSSGSAGLLAPSGESRSRKLWKVLVPAAMLLVVGAIAGGLYLRSRQAQRLTEKDTIVLTDFANSTGDAIFDDTLKTALGVSLQQSPFLNVLSDREVSKTLTQMTRPAGTKLTPELARDLCQRASSKAYIAGAIGSLGSKYVLELKAVNCRSGDTLADEQVTAPSKDKVLDSLGETASKLRGELGESLATVQKFDVPLEQATTSSLEALKAYSFGEVIANEKGMAAGLPSFQRSIELDPNFAIGYQQLGAAYLSLGEVGRSLAYTTKAFQLREHAGERERLGITANYYMNVTGELDKAAQTYQEYITAYPESAVPFGNLARLYAELGEYDKATQTEKGKPQLGPTRAYAYQNLANFSLGLQHFDDARQMAQLGLQRFPNDFIAHSALYALAFINSDSPAMGELQQWFAGKDEYQNFGLALASDTEAYAGHLSKARDLMNQAVDSAVRTDNKETGAIYRANAAIAEAVYGNARESRESAAEALKLAPASQGAESEAALAFAMAGDVGRAESLAQDMGKRFPLDTQVQALWLPAIRAQLALDQKNSPAAVTVLQAASAVELGQIQFVNNLSCLYHVYIRGEAYLAAGQSSAAAAEFQKIIDHNGMVWNCWTGALAHLGVARANALQSRTLQAQGQAADADATRVRALAAYKDFLTLWKDADAGIPILKQAQSEYAKLQ